MLSAKSRKTIAGLAAGAFILAGLGGALAVQAESVFKERPGHHQCYQIKPEQAAERLSADFGIDKSLIQKYQEQGRTFKDLHRAALFAKAGDTSFEDALALKNDNNTWKDVARTLNIDKAKVKTVRQEIAAKHIAQRFNIAQTDIKSLFDQGYHSRDIAMAGKLAVKSDTSIQDVILLKKVNNTWKDVATDLGVDWQALKKEHRNTSTN